MKEKVHGYRKTKALRTYIVYAMPGFLSSSVLVHAAVNFTQFQDQEVLTADALNSRLNEIAQQVEQIQVQIADGSPTLIPLAGLANVSQGSAEVTGNQTLFLTQLDVGDAVSIAGEIHTVESITSDTMMTVNGQYSTSASDESIFVEDKILIARDMDNNAKFTVDKRGNVITNGYSIRRVAVKTGQSGIFNSTSTSPVVVSGRELAVDKLLDNSKLRLTYSDNLGSNAQGDCHWEFYIDNARCPSNPALFYVGNNTGAFFPIGTLVAYCASAAGSHTVDLRMWGNGQECKTSFGSGFWTLEAEEVMTN
jgi:hypothetical protein